VEVADLPVAAGRSIVAHTAPVGGERVSSPMASAAMRVLDIAHQGAAARLSAHRRRFGRPRDVDNTSKTGIAALAFGRFAGSSATAPRLIGNPARAPATGSDCHAP